MNDEAMCRFRQKFSFETFLSDVKRRSMFDYYLLSFLLLFLPIKWQPSLWINCITKRSDYFLSSEDTPFCSNLFYVRINIIHLMHSIPDLVTRTHMRIDQMVIEVPAKWNTNWNIYIVIDIFELCDSVRFYFARAIRNVHVCGFRGRFHVCTKFICASNAQFEEVTQSTPNNQKSAPIFPIFSLLVSFPIYVNWKLRCE